MTRRTRQTPDSVKAPIGTHDHQDRSTAFLPLRSCLLDGRMRLPRRQNYCSCERGLRPLSHERLLPTGIAFNWLHTEPHPAVQPARPQRQKSCRTVLVVMCSYGRLHTIRCLPRAAGHLVVRCLSTLGRRAHHHLVCITGKADMHCILHHVNFQ